MLHSLTQKRDCDYNSKREEYRTYCGGKEFSSDLQN